MGRSKERGIAMDRKTLALLLSALSNGDSYTKAEIDEMISQLKQFNMEVVDALPVTDIQLNCIYFVRKQPVGTDSCYEYIYVDGKWEFIGSTEIDLTNYWTIDETKAYIEQNKYVLPEATATTLGGIKLDSDSFSINEEGKMELSTIEDGDIESLFTTISA